MIGNAAYAGSPLDNPVNDARAMAAKLQQLGFEVVKRENLSGKQIGSTLREFRSRLSTGAEALFFYAGHGLQVKGVNYLPAVDADISAEEDVSNQSLSVNQVLEVMEDSKTRLNLVFLDACRNNPFSRRFRALNEGLAKVNAPSGTILSFATRPGSVAADGDGRNGLYTEHLLAVMDKSGVPIEQALKEVLSRVKQASRGKQEPWWEGGIEGNFYFIQGPVTVNVSSATPSTGLDPAQVELEFWTSIKGSNDRADFEEYLKHYPNGKFAGIARNRVKQLSGVGSRVRVNEGGSGREGGELALWKAVEGSSNESDYEAYLEQYPKGKYAVLARTRLKKLQEQAQAAEEEKERKGWLDAERLGTEEGYRRYLSGWPKGNYVGVANLRLKKLEREGQEKAEEVAWQGVVPAEQVSEVEVYLNRYPSGRHAEEARQKQA